MTKHSMTELNSILIDIQDKLVPILDSYEQAIYHYLFRHTYLSGKQQALFSTRTAEIGFGSGDRTKKPSWKTRSDKLRSLEQKGCIQIVERSNKGILVEILLPHEIPALQILEVSHDTFNMETLDFFKDRRLLPSLLYRESSRCFYTGRKITVENCYLDHVIPQVEGGGNSYRNIVASCFDANSIKNNKTADEFIRILFKEELISLKEFNMLKAKLADLQAGNIKPDIELVRAVILNQHRAELV